MVDGLDILLLLCFNLTVRKCRKQSVAIESKLG